MLVYVVMEYGLEGQSYILGIATSRSLAREIALERAHNKPYSNQVGDDRWEYNKGLDSIEVEAHRVEE